LPTVNCEVRLIEAAREMDVLEHYQPATGDGSRPGVYYLNGAHVEERPLHRLAAWTYHEANPGHHLQSALEQAEIGRTPLRRFIADYAAGAFVEGWGLYSERLAEEMGLYRNEYERLGMLDAQAFRIARLVVDTGLHALGWDPVRLVNVLGDAGLSREEADIELDRYVALPAQALTYRIGQRQIEKWRARFTRQSDTGTLSQFHDRLLELGSLPLNVIALELPQPPT
jgi:uncharacterized protein (DUF885 family)